MDLTRPKNEPKKAINQTKIEPKLAQNWLEIDQEWHKMERNLLKIDQEWVNKGSKKTQNWQNNQSKIDHLAPKCLPHYRSSQDGESTLSRFECIFLLLGWSDRWGTALIDWRLKWAWNCHKSSVWIWSVKFWSPTCGWNRSGWITSSSGIRQIMAMCAICMYLHSTFGCLTLYFTISE